MGYGMQLKLTKIIDQLITHKQVLDLNDRKKETLSKQVIGQILHHGFIPLKEGGFDDASQYPNIAALLAKDALQNEFGTKTNDLNITSIYNPGKRLSFEVASKTIPTLLISFFSGNPALYKQCLEHEHSKSLMKWACINQEGQFDLDILDQISVSDINTLTKEIFLRNVSDPHGKCAIKGIIHFWGILVPQIIFCKSCNQIDPLLRKCEEITSFIIRHVAWLGSGYCHYDLELDTRHLRMKAVFPFFEHWGKFVAEDFLGKTLSFDDMLPDFYLDLRVMPRSPLNYYFGFIAANEHEKIMSFRTLEQYISKLEVSGVSESRYASEGMIHLLRSRHPFAIKNEKGFYCAWEKLHNSGKPNPENPLTVFCLERNNETSKKYFWEYFCTIVSTKTPKARAGKMLTTLSETNSQELQDCIARYMCGKTVASAVKKLYPFFTDGSKYAEKLSESLREDQLLKDLGF